MAKFGPVRSELTRQPHLYKATVGSSRGHTKDAESIPLLLKNIEEEGSLQKQSMGVYSAAQAGRSSHNHPPLTSQTCSKCPVPASH